MPGVNKQSPKYVEARESLPEDLHPVYEQLVEEYAFFTMRHYGQGYVAYKIIASLVENGWRSTEQKSRRIQEHGGEE